MTQNKKLNLIRTALYFGMIFWLGACTENEPPPQYQQPDTREETMHLTKDHPTPPSAIPDIDAAAPDRFETATFGLG